jgi:hypothetical protein
MYHKLRNTLASLAIVASVLGVSYSVGQAPSTSTSLLATNFNDIRPGNELIVQERGQGSGKHRLIMPYFSFASLLPRRGL